MNERPTPETDAAVDDTAFEDKNQLHTDWVTAFFARKLERERDEAIRQRDETNRSSKYACDYNYEQKLKAERERDEAREVLQRIADADWKSAGELRGIAREALEAVK